MPTKNPVSITLEGPTFFSAHDEEVFFAWLTSIPAVLNVGGIGTQLQIEFGSTRITQRDLRELLALFQRYVLDKRDLRMFDSPRHAWFRNRHAYWHTDVFRAVARRLKRNRGER